MRMLMKDDIISRKRKYDEFLDKASHLSYLWRKIRYAFRNPNLDMRSDAFGKMEKLRLLKLNYAQLAGCYDNFPKNLIWLCWHGFPLKYMPIELSLEKLVALDLRHSELEEVWAGPKFLGSLKILNLSYSKRLAKTPNFLGVPNLERLILKGCINLIEICESIEFLDRLDLLDLEACKNLRKLPRNMRKLRSLETLNMKGCSNLFAGGLLFDMSATRTANGQANWWRSLLLPQVPQPIKGPEILWDSLPHSLTSLNLSHCNLSNDSLPCAFSNLSLLKHLDLTFNLFVSLPDCVASLNSLRRLSLAACRSLDSILGLPSNLQSLDLHTCDSLRKIAFQSAPRQLDEIKTKNCDKVVEIEGILKREPIGEVDGRIIKNLGIDIESMGNLEVELFGLSNIIADPIQGFYEFGIFSTFILGGEIPSCFSERKKGSLMSFIVPRAPNFRIQCLNVCSVYAYSRDDMPFPAATKINNKTKNLTWVYSPMYFGIPHRDQDMTWFCQWNFGNQLEGGDEIVVSIVMGDMLEVKECGIKIVYEEDDGVVENDDNCPNKTYFHWNEVIGGDLSHLKLSTGEYFLNRHLYGRKYKCLYGEAFRGILDFEEIKERKVRCGVGKY